MVIHQCECSVSSLRSFFKSKQQLTIVSVSVNYGHGHLLHDRDRDRLLRGHLRHAGVFHALIFFSVLLQLVIAVMPNPNRIKVLTVKIFLLIV
jgi:hypothetical protein